MIGWSLFPILNLRRLKYISQSGIIEIGEGEDTLAEEILLNKNTNKPLISGPNLLVAMSGVSRFNSPPWDSSATAPYRVSRYSISLPAGYGMQASSMTGFADCLVRGLLHFVRKDELCSVFARIFFPSEATPE